MDNQESSQRLVTVKEMVSLSRYQWLTEAALRHLIFNSENRISSSGDIIHGNGLVDFGAIIRIGRKVLIDLERFEAWINSQRFVGEV